MQTKILVLALAVLGVGGCGRHDETALGAQSSERNTPDGPLLLGFWPGEPRKFAMEKARELTNGHVIDDGSHARVVELPNLEVDRLPCVVELTFHQDRLLTVYVGFLTKDPSEIRRVQESLTARYGNPDHPKTTATSVFQQWVIKKPLPFTVVSGSAPMQLFYVSGWDAGPLFRLALPSVTVNRESDERRIRELAKKHGL